jgi:hypothetical protein
MFLVLINISTFSFVRFNRTVLVFLKNFFNFFRFSLSKKFLQFLVPIDELCPNIIIYAGIIM